MKRRDMVGATLFRRSLPGPLKNLQAKTIQPTGPTSVNHITNWPNCVTPCLYNAFIWNPSNHAFLLAPCHRLLQQNRPYKIFPHKIIIFFKLTTFSTMILAYETNFHPEV
jgi:hypothetical protein